MGYYLDSEDLARRAEQTILRPTSATSLDDYISQLAVQMEMPNTEGCVRGVLEKAVEMYTCFRDELGCRTIGSVMKAISERKVDAALMMQWVREGRFTVAIPAGVIEEGYPELGRAFQKSRDGIVAQLLYTTGTEGREPKRTHSRHKSIA